MVFCIPALTKMLTQMNTEAFHILYFPTKFNSDINQLGVGIEYCVRDLFHVKVSANMILKTRVTLYLLSDGTWVCSKPTCTSDDQEERNKLELPDTGCFVCVEE